MPRIVALPHLDTRNYQRHMLHAEERVWVEKNCYVDIWIELIHALGLEPLAMLPFTLAIDFEGDQWTFFKPPHSELRTLYGIDVQELNVWRPLLEHAVEHLAAGKLISTEADAFWLADTSGTDYRRQHTKSTIVLCDLDVEAQRLGYFHNAGYFELSGEDFVRLMRVDAAPDPQFMPWFAEIVRVDRINARPQAELAAISRELLRTHLARVPTSNPVRRFQQRFERDFPELQARGLAHYHTWAFATIRQLGAAFELAALHLRWLSQTGESGLEPAATEFEKISSGCKTLILKAARAINARRAFDSAPLFDDSAAAWQRGLESLSARIRT